MYYFEFSFSHFSHFSPTKYKVKNINDIVMRKISKLQKHFFSFFSKQYKYEKKL